jgi:transposase
MLKKAVTGRPPLPQSTIDEIKKYVVEGYSLRSIAKHMGISVTTVFKYKHDKDA